MLRIRWPEKISNEEPLRRTGTSNVSDKIANRKWETIGHVLRMDNNRIGTTVLILHPEGRHKVGRPKQHGAGLLSKNEQSSVRIVGRGQEQQPRRDKDGGRLFEAICASGHEKIGKAS